MLDTPNVSFSIANVVIPKSGPKTIPVTMDFTGVDTHEVDLTQLVETGKIEYVQTIYVDNYDNPSILTVETDLTNQRIIIPAGTQGYYSILQPNPCKLTFETTAGAFVVRLQCLNVPVQPSVWNTSTSTGGLTDTELRASAVEVTVENGAYTNRSRALTGASVALAVANANRRLLIVQNPNAANPIAISLTGIAAVLNGQGSMTIPAGGIVVLDTVAPTGAINVIGTNLDLVSAWEA